jgi:hypothetical protein
MNKKLVLDQSRLLGFKLLVKDPGNPFAGSAMIGKVPAPVGAKVGKIPAVALIGAKVGKVDRAQVAFSSIIGAKIGKVA